MVGEKSSYRSSTIRQNSFPVAHSEIAWFRQLSCLRQPLDLPVKVLRRILAIAGGVVLLTVCAVFFWLYLHTGDLPKHLSRGSAEIAFLPLTFKVGGHGMNVDERGNESGSVLVRLPWSQPSRGILCHLEMRCSASCVYEAFATRGDRLGVSTPTSQQRNGCDIASERTAVSTSP